MCVILDKEPGKVIPANMLDLACDINVHGFGISWIKDKKLQIERDTVTNDPKRISDFLQKIQDKRVYIHLRHATKGKVIPENSHPFFGLNHELGFMHNGTLYAWTPSDDKFSDSKCFFDNMVHPLAAMSRKYTGPEWLLKNHLFRKIIGDYCVGLSVFLVFDNLGHVWRVNEKQGKQYDGFWASNDYSFDKHHNRSSWRGDDTTPFVRGTGSTSGGARGTLWTPGQLDLPGMPVTPYTEGGGAQKIGNIRDFFENAHALAARSKRGSRVSDRAFEISGVTGWLEAQSRPKACEVPVSNISSMEGPRRSFEQESGFAVKDVMEKFSERDLENLAESFPKATACLIVDMFVQNQILERQIERYKVQLQMDNEDLIA